MRRFDLTSCGGPDHPVKTVFHVHTDHSDDCNNSVDRLIVLARERGIGCIAVADHDTIGGAREMAAKASPDLRVIIGQEITTKVGHLIGLFLREAVKPGMSPRKTAEAIKAQGGLVVVPHPYNRMFGCGLCRHAREIIDLIDVVEVSNAQNIFDWPNRAAEKLAHSHRFPRIVGVDIHHGDNLDACYQWVEPFDTPEGFVQSLRRASFAKGRHDLAYFAKTAWYVFLDRSGIGLPETFGHSCTASRSQLARETI